MKVINEVVRKESTRNTEHLSKRCKEKRYCLSSTYTMCVCVLIYQSVAVWHFHCPLYKRQFYYQVTVNFSKPNL